MSLLADAASFAFKATCRFLARSRDHGIVAVATFAEVLDVLIPEGVLDDIRQLKDNALIRDSAKAAEQVAAARERVAQAVREENGVELTRLRELQELESRQAACDSSSSVEMARAEKIRAEAERIRAQSRRTDAETAVLVESIRRLREYGGSVAADPRELEQLIQGASRLIEMTTGQSSDDAGASSTADNI
jgi:hypothetical protein